MQVGRKIYYERSTGYVIVDTKERSGDVRETTTEEDFARYKSLAERVPETVGCLQLEYGQFAQDFLECNGYRVIPETLELEFSYPDPNEPEPQEPIYRKPLSEEVETLKAADLDNKEAIATLYEMMLGGI